MKQKRRYILNNSLLSIIFMLFLGSNILAQDVLFTANANNTAKAGEPFIIQYQLEAPQKGTNFEYPEMSGINVLNVGTSSFTQTTVINGKMSKSYTLTWTLTAVANNQGKQTIPAASVTVNGKTFKSNSLDINITAGNGNNNVANNNQPSIDNTVENNENIPEKDIFLNLTTNKTEAYVGEPIYIYTRLYSRYNVNLSEFNPSAMDNFWIQDLPMPNSVKADYTTLNGKQYLTAVLEKKVIFPQKSGDISIEPYNATFQLYDNWGFPYGNKKVVSNKKVITVKPLPANKPAGFTGAVGDFNITSEIDNNEIEIDNAINITLTISGIGNFGLFDDPEMKVPKTFEELLPDVKTNTKVTENGIEGSKSYKLTYIPRVPGNYTIKGVSFSYFDLKSKKYITKTTNPIEINIEGDSTMQIANGNKSKIEVEEIGEDIRFIKTAGLSLYPKNNFIYGKLGFWLAYLIPFVGFLISIFLLRKKIKENANIELIKSKKADKVSAKRLKTADNNLKQGNFDIFYEEINKALWGYISDKLSIPLSELTRQNAVNTLSAQNVEEQLINDFIKTIDDAEIARYAPSSVGITPESIYQRASSIISNFEKKIQLLKVKN
ncbi:MAG: protein BatD [Bacteroidales bacterium]|nr:protein BatD [Bacteroidales bacterium]